MINYTKKLDKAIRKAARAHEQAGQHRKGTDIPYIIHPFGVMIIAASITNDEDTLIACLMHDVLEDVAASIFNESQMRQEFGDRVVSIVKDVTKDDSIEDWHKRSRAYLNHLEFNASDEAVIVSAADKIHNLLSMLSDYETVGEDLWQRFTTKSSADQVWWYESILEVIEKRNAPQELCLTLSRQLDTLKSKLQTNANQFKEHKNHDEQ